MAGRSKKQTGKRGATKVQPEVISPGESGPYQGEHEVAAEGEDTKI